MIHKKTFSGVAHRWLSLNRNRKMTRQESRAVAHGIRDLLSIGGKIEWIADRLFVEVSRQRINNEKRVSA